MHDLNDWVYDYRLGYIRADSMGGFNVLGEEAAPGGRIVTLGGYTTPAEIRAQTSWGNLLQQRLHAQVLHGCTDGYTSAQELTMLLRDGILFRPRHVVCISGFYNFAYRLGLVPQGVDAAFLQAHPFATPRQMAFYRKITARFGLGNDRVYYGEACDMPAWEYWLKQVESMWYVCEEFGIPFLMVLQPCVFSGGYVISPAEAERLCAQYGLPENAISEYAAGFQREYANAAEQMRGKDYILDLSGLFDQAQDVYLDACHLDARFMPGLVEAICARMEEAI